VCVCVCVCVWRAACACLTRLPNTTCLWYPGVETRMARKFHLDTEGEPCIAPLARGSRTARVPTAGGRGVERGTRIVQAALGFDSWMHADFASRMRCLTKQPAHWMDVGSRHVLAQGGAYVLGQPKLPPPQRSKTNNGTTAKKKSKHGAATASPKIILPCNGEPDSEVEAVVRCLVLQAVLLNVLLHSEFYSSPCGCYIAHYRGLSPRCLGYDR
jgi:hypothetical protein